MKALALCAALLVLSSTFLTAQNRKVDSLRNALKTEKEDTNKVNTLNLLSDRLWRVGYYDTAMIYANKALALSNSLVVIQTQASGLKQNGWTKGIAGAFRNLGIIYDDKGDYFKGLEYCQKALDIDEKIGNKKSVSANLCSIGAIYDELGNYPKALEYQLKALNMDQEIGNKKGIAVDLGNIGNVYFDQYNYPKALEYDNRALSMERENGNKNNIAANLSNIGLVYHDMHDYTKSLDYHFKALSIYQELGNKRGIAINFGNIGTIYFEQENYAKSLDYHTRALNIAREIGNSHGVAINIGNIGQIYTELKDYKKAKAYLDSSLIMLKNIGDKDDIKDDYKNLADFDSATGNYKQQLEDYKKYIIYRDSLVNESNTKKTVQAEMNFGFEQKQAAEKAEQDKKDAIAEQERKKQVVIRDAFMGGFALMLALAFFIFRGYRQKLKANEIISHQKAVVEEKQKEILDSIHYAQRIQKALLASDILLSKHFPEYFLFYKPKDIVSGDFYWVTEKGNKFYLAVCDSTGHGVPGAFMSLLNISFLNEAITEKNIIKPHEVFNHTRKRLIENISQDGQQDGMDGILISLPANGSMEGQMDYTAAYNSPLIIRNGNALELEADKIPVGASPKQDESFTAKSFNLQKGDMVYAFTDGYADQFGGPKGKKFKYKQLQEKLLAISPQSMAEQEIIIKQTFEDWKGNLEQVDDVLIMGIRV